jgi:hypothetical protein
MAFPTSTDTNVSGDILHSIPIMGKDGSNTILAAEIRILADGLVRPGKVPTRIEFYTTTTAGTLTKALTIDATQSIPTLTNALLSINGVETGITAHAGGTQAAAFALSATKTVHNVTTVGTAADSVVLPASTGGGVIHWVKNSAAANSLQLFGLSADTIDGVAAATGVAVAAGKSRICLDFALGTWLSILGA